MADCRIVNQNVASSVTNIDNLATKYANAGTEFETALRQLSPKWKAIPKML